MNCSFIIFHWALTHLSRPVVENSVDEGHDGGLEVDVVAVLPGAAVEVVDDALEKREKECILALVHGLLFFYWHRIYVR